jgi:hypothetical protein
MPFEHFPCALALGLISLALLIANWRLQSTVRELGRLLASRSFTDYAIGAKKLESPPPPKKKTEPGYENVFNEIGDRG